MGRIDEGYSVEIDLVDKYEWNSLLNHFADGSFYQTWSFGAYGSDGKNISHAVLRKEEAVVAMAQLRLIKMPGLPIGIAYLSWGPIYRAKDKRQEEQYLRNMIRALYNEYVIRRRYFLRIIPHLLNTKEEATIKDIYMEEGYQWSDLPGQNVIIDLSPTLEKIRQNMHHKWRQTLRAAERKNLDIIEGNDNKICRLALEVIRDMKGRKNFLGGNQEEIIMMQSDLPESLKLKLLVCMENREPVATLGWVTFGRIGVPLVGATGTKALKTKSSYLLWWRMIEYYKNHGFVAVDMGSVNQRRNPGGYYFKTHILGGHLEEQPHYIGQFSTWRNHLSLVFFNAIYKSREVLREIRSMI